MKIWEPKPPGTLGATPRLLRDDFTLIPFFTAQLKQIQIQKSLFSEKLQQTDLTRSPASNFLPGEELEEEKTNIDKAKLIISRQKIYGVWEYIFEVTKILVKSAVEMRQ
jgi:hypothetical protein